MIYIFMHEQFESNKYPIIIAVDLDETLYSSKKPGIVYLVDIKKFFEIIQWMTDVFSIINKPTIFTVITCKPGEDDIVKDMKNNIKLHLGIDPRNIFCLGNSGGPLGRALRKMQAIENICQQNDASLTDVLFIDDAAININVAKARNVNCVHAHFRCQLEKENTPASIDKMTDIMMFDIVKCFKKILYNYGFVITNKWEIKSLYYPLLPLFNNTEYDLNEEFQKEFTSFKL